jgi:unsaturated chondroitin disaccharide hydrolase
LNNQTSWNFVPVSLVDWTIGFWPGVLWYNYESARDEAIKRSAIHYTDLLEPLAAFPAYDHDKGFQFFCSYGNAYRLTGNEQYKQIILNVADTLATLFNPNVGTILSWPREVEPRNWPHNTIVDNMINLEMLFWAAKNGGNKALYDVAVRHAETTMQHQFRDDGGCFHVVVYDSVSGDVLQRVTHQGYADSSLWARGQAWAIYGYTMVYRETKEDKYLRFAEKVSDLFLSRLLPNQYVPYWDFDAPNIPDEPKDASAAAIVASAWLELSLLTDNAGKASLYRQTAIKMLEELSSEQFQSRAINPALLKRSTGHHPNGTEIEASIIYADYYYIEALTRLKKMQQRKCIYENL